MYSGHTSYHGCRICIITGDQKDNRRSGIYFSNKAGLDYRMRTKEDFITGDVKQGIRNHTPFSLLDSFTGACFFGLDELHLWGQNIGKQIWSIVTDNNQRRSGIRNPLFLRNTYREKLGGKLLEAHALHNKNVQGGRFVNMTTSAGYARAVDIIDFLMYAVPTLLVEALEEQVEDLKAKRAKEIEKQSKQRSRRKGKERAVDINDDENNYLNEIINCFDQTAEALISLSLGCQISEKYYVSSEDISEVDRHVQKWHLFLGNFLGINNFTVNQHYLLHVSHFIKEYGPLKPYSNRAMERTIGFCKDNIKSRSKPGENAINFLRGNFTESRQKWYASDKNNGDDSKEPLKLSLDDFDDMINPDNGPFEDMLKNFCASTILQFDDNDAFYIKGEYKLVHNGQTLKKTRGRNGIDVVYNRSYVDETSHLKFGNIQEMFDFKGTPLALIKGGRILEDDRRKRMYVSSSALVESSDTWEIINLDVVMGYAIKLTSLTSTEKLYICFKK